MSVIIEQTIIWVAMKEYFKFLDVDGFDYPLVKQQLLKSLSPLYGDQSSAIQKLEKNKDRICELYYENEVIRGLIIFKNHLSNEYAEYGIVNGFEEKTTLPIIFEDEVNRRRSLRFTTMLKLLNRASDHAIAMNAQSFFGTVSGEKNGTLRLLFRLGFEEVAKFHNKFKSGVTEHLIVHKNIGMLYELTKVEPKRIYVGSVPPE